MSASLAVDLLLGLGVAAQLLCCLGVLVMRTAADRLHYAAAGTTVGPVLVLAAVLVREGVTSAGLQAIAAVGVLFLVNPVLVHATGRAARLLDAGTLEASAAERRRGSA
jgi:multicomponent Na+:H+ antiporter subunit G